MRLRPGRSSGYFSLHQIRAPAHRGQWGSGRIRPDLGIGAAPRSLEARRAIRQTLRLRALGGAGAVDREASRMRHGLLIVQRGVAPVSLPILHEVPDPILGVGERGGIEV